MDDPSIINADGSWSKERYDEIVGKLTPFLKSCGYNPKKDIIFLPMSGLLGQNIKDPAPAGVCPWYKVRDWRPSLLSALNVRPLRYRD